MWEMSTRLAASLIASNQVVVNRLEVLHGGEVVFTVEGRSVIDPASHSLTSLISGDVTIDRATVRRGCTVTLVDLSDVLTPTDVDDLFVPLSTEIRLWRGLLYADRTIEEAPDDRELVPLGTFVVSRVGGSPWPSLTLVGFDRMWRFNQGRLRRERVVVSGTVVTDLMIDMLTERMPAGTLSLNIPAAVYTTPTLVWDQMDEPGELLHDLAESIGMQFFCDPMGTFTLAKEPTVDDDPVWTYAYGPRSVLLPWPSEEIDAEAAKNVVVVTGEPLDDQPPFYGEAANDDPDSSLYVPRVGEFTVFQSGGIYTSNEQCELAAKTILAKQGMSDIVAFAGVVNPALDSGDCVLVQSPHPRNISTRVLVDSFTVPLQSIGPQQFTARAKVTLR